MVSVHGEIGGYWSLGKMSTPATDSSDVRGRVGLCDCYVSVGAAGCETNLSVIDRLCWLRNCYSNEGLVNPAGFLMVR